MLMRKMLVNTGVIWVLALGRFYNTGQGTREPAKSPSSCRVLSACASVQIHSEESLGKSRPRLTSKFLPHRRRPVPMPHMGPGLSREDENRHILVNEPYESEH
jgi:hypothetical protein